MSRGKLYACFIILLTFPGRAQFWAPLGEGFNNGGPIDYPRIMYSDTVTNKLYVGGAFDAMDNKPIRGVACWDGIKWDSLGAGIDALQQGWSIPQATQVITRYNGKIYFGGGFVSVGDKNAIAIGTWDGNDWDTLSVMPFKTMGTAFVVTMEPIDNVLYVGGTFDTLNGMYTRSFASWNDTAWTVYPDFPIYSSWTSYVNAIKKYNGEIYIAGNFSNSINDTIMDIIRYDGQNWRSVGGGMKGSLTNISDMEVYNNELYIAGLFLKSEGNVGNNIQKWDGTSWSEVGGGTSWSVWDLEVHNNELYAAGSFIHAGGVPTVGVAKWNGTEWCSVGGVLDYGAECLTFFRDTLYLGGGFKTIDGDTVNMIAKYLGGNYTDSCGVSTSVFETEKNTIPELDVYPNPSTNIFNVSIQTNDFCQFEIHNSIGEIISSGSFAQKTVWAVSGWQSGIYFVSVSDGKNIWNKKLIKQ